MPDRGTRREELRVLREIIGVRQDRADVRRRWLQDDYFDLFLWTDQAGELMAFQLAYDRAGDEHLLEWERTRGFLHRRVDDSRGHLMGIRGAPVLAMGKRFRKYRVVAEFDARSATLEAPLCEVVRKRLIAYVPARRHTRTWQRGLRRAHRF
jgi:hypothetical protein